MEVADLSLEPLLFTPTPWRQTSWFNKAGENQDRFSRILGLNNRFLYPTSFSSGDPIEYDGPRDADGIAEWLRSFGQQWPIFKGYRVETMTKQKKDNGTTNLLVVFFFLFSLCFVSLCFLVFGPCGFQGKREKPAVEEIEASGVDSFIQKGLESNSYVPRLEVEKFSMNFVCLVVRGLATFTQTLR